MTKKSLSADSPDIVWPEILIGANEEIVKEDFQDKDLAEKIRQLEELAATCVVIE